MTPLANAIFKDQCRRVSRRAFVDNCDFLPEFNDFHCFEVSEIVDLATDLVCRNINGALDRAGDSDVVDTRSVHEESLSFLPAPKTWIESEVDPGYRRGFLIVDVGEDSAAVYVVEGGKSVLGSLCAFMLPLGQHRDFGSLPTECHTIGGDQAEAVSISQMATHFLYGLLACINSPKIIHRKTRFPSRAAERRALDARKWLGHFPLHAWSEIKLDVNARDASGDPEQEAHLTGTRALHFVRAFLRIRNGRLEHVRAHWRGDASVGIKRQRYRVVDEGRAGRVS